MDDTRSDVATLGTRLDAARTRIDRLEFVLERLVDALETRGVIDRTALAEVVRAAPALVDQATCVHCGRTFEVSVLVVEEDGFSCVGCHLAG